MGRLLPSPGLPLPVLTPASTAVHPGPWGSKEVGVGVEVVELLLLLGQDAQVLLDSPSPTHCSVPEI